MSSSAVHPTWAPFRSTVAAEERLRFSLRLMDGGCSPGGLVSLSSPWLLRAPVAPNPPHAGYRTFKRSHTPRESPK